MPFLYSKTDDLSRRNTFYPGYVEPRKFLGLDRWSALLPAYISQTNSGRQTVFFTQTRPDGLFLCSPAFVLKRNIWTTNLYMPKFVLADDPSSSRILPMNSFLMYIFLTIGISSESPSTTFKWNTHHFAGLLNHLLKPYIPIEFKCIIWGPFNVQIPQILAHSVFTDRACHIVCILSIDIHILR